MRSLFRLDNLMDLIYEKACGDRTNNENRVF